MNRERIKGMRCHVTTLSWAGSTCIMDEVDDQCIYKDKERFILDKHSHLQGTTFDCMITSLRPIHFPIATVEYY